MSRDEMIRKVFILIFLLPHAFSENCVRYTFEENFNYLFTNELGACNDETSLWKLGTYNTSDVTGHHELSSTFITPLETLSCVSSFMFSMTHGGTVEVVIYMESNATSDQIMVLANEHFEDGEDKNMGLVGNSPMSDNFVSGWHTLVIPLSSTGTSEGYVSILFSIYNFR